MDEIQMAESLKFSGYSCRLSQKSNSPQKKRKYLCYDCGGDPKSSKYCSTCKGDKIIQSNNPLAQLLADVISCKLNLKTEDTSQLPEIRQTLKPHCSQIKQESYMAEDRYIYCDECQIQDAEESGNFMECKQCKHYYVCSNCYKKQGYKHQHHLTKYCVSESSGWDSGEQAANDQIPKQCHCCRDEIQDRGIYLACENCRSQKIIYEICSKCSDNKTYKHSVQHIFKPSLYRVPMKKKQIQKNPFADQYWIQENDRYHNSQIFVDEDEQRQIFSATKKNKQTSKFQGIYRKNNLLNLPRKSQPLEGNKYFSPQKSEMSSRVRVMIDQTDSEVSQNGAPAGNIFFGSEIQVVQEQRIEREDCLDSQDSQLSESDYIFREYACDQCGSHPRKIRYHCKRCEDYDLCSGCYRVNKQSEQHMHSQFQKITKEIEDKIEQQKNRQKQERKQKVLNKFGNLNNINKNRKSLQ